MAGLNKVPPFNQVMKQTRFIVQKVQLVPVISNQMNFQFESTLLN